MRGFVGKSTDFEECPKIAISVSTCSNDVVIIRLKNLQAGTKFILHVIDLSILKISHANFN